MLKRAMTHDVCIDQILAELLEMGFEFNQVTEAIESVGPHRDKVLELMLNPSHDISKRSENRPASNLRQPSIKDHIMRFGGTKRKSCGTDVCGIASDKKTTAQTEPQICKPDNEISYHISNSGDCEKKTCGPCQSFMEKESISKEASKGYENMDNKLKNHTSHLGGCEKEPGVSSSICESTAEKDFLAEEASYDCKNKNRIEAILQKHFGFGSLKGFQKEALDTWANNKDCLVLAATGSGTHLFLQLRMIFFHFVWLDQEFSSVTLTSKNRNLHL
jgi:werner syndrome ATP-dependent helicase